MPEQLLGENSRVILIPTSGAMIQENMLREAARLARDGEIGNSDAIRLLQMPHSTVEVKEVLRLYAHLMTPQAKSKLTVESFAPLPAGVDNQRYEPIFDKYLVTGRTHTTAHGAVVLTEIQYYHGHMVHIHGECANAAGIAGEMAGSGFTHLTLRYPDGRETVPVQIWAQKLGDTSLRPYDSMFIVIPAVPEGAPTNRSVIVADANGLSSVLTMLNGHYDPAHACYENDAHLYFVRLYDSTQVAIDVGRERMGTDKRPGSVELTPSGRALNLVLKDGVGRLMVNGSLRLGGAGDAFVAQVQQAAATAGVDSAPHPVGTEMVFPAVARIGRGPISQWHWRTDVIPSLYPAEVGALRFDASSEEGAMMIKWGFRPRVLSYIPNVRGVITGLDEASGDAPSTVTQSIPAQVIAPTRSSSVSPVPWTNEQWQRLCQAVQETARKGRVAASFLPIETSAVGGGEFVSKNAIRVEPRTPAHPTGKVLNVIDDESQDLLTLEADLLLRDSQMRDPEMVSALQLFGRATSVLVRLEDAVILNGRTGDKPDGPVVDLGEIWRIIAGSTAHDRGLHSGVGPSVIVTHVAGESTFGGGLVRAISEAVGMVEAAGHPGPFACVLGKEFFRDIQTPNVGSLVLPQDRIQPFLLGGPLLRSSRLGDQCGVLVALDNAAVDLVVAQNISIEFLQVTPDAGFAFRVREKIALRVKDASAIVSLRA